MTDEQQAAAVEAVLRGDEKCARCSKWSHPSLMHATVSLDLLPDGMKGGRVCRNCILEVLPQASDALERVEHLRKGLYTFAVPITSITKDGAIMYEGEFTNYEVTKTTLTSRPAKKDSYFKWLYD